MIPALLAKFGVPFLIDILSGSLGKVNHPAAESASLALKDVKTAIDTKQISLTQIQEANRHVEAMEKLSMEGNTNVLQEINKSLRAEVQSEDRYVRRMRPTFGYLLAVTWTAQMLALAYVIVFKTSQSGQIIASMESMGMIWTIGLSVLGIYVYKRSDEKKKGLQ